MSNIPFTTRVAGRYRFRRRIHFRALISRPLTISLHTADPDEARTRSALLQAVKRRVKSLYVLGGDFLSARGTSTASVRSDRPSSRSTG